MLQCSWARFEAAVGVDFADYKKELGVGLVHLAYLSHAAVPEAQPDAETGQQLQQPTVVRQQLGKFGVFREYGLLCCHDVSCLLHNEFGCFTEIFTLDLQEKKAFFQSCNA
jgi:hypothetical protein